METVTFTTVTGQKVSLPAKDYLYSKRDDGNPAVRTLVFYTGNAPDGGFLNTPYTAVSYTHLAVVESVKHAILRR